ncbi:MAG: UDP-N-acetylmuramate--L-alanine ligase [Deltaproteobacteria bacterium]|nr:UDP-N-acetylmuramate--L-alanine ligase [Deltaproteobacteria bacterium]MBW2018543.1 UDP-N-acetylmuramate--L-alanine ligase [Deltaproteobacteria bacterium]MBW2073278.1 UDP-N-acetylmuramate--L-alanine ligase [Deltaproteobacteria bacterium]RLB83330.1 MAG: UDP-N-acetylmuramate--L-alanine ligase [Deltaproteobacteria bacterium]
MYQKSYHIHFVGIGGIGMSGIAELLLNLGYKVSGSDLRLTDITTRLAQLGGTIFQGHRPEHIQGADVVVVSSAVEADNPEVVAAKEAIVPVIPRAEMLAELMRLKYSIAVAGAHGKTTTTWMIASVLDQGGFDPTVVIGGKLDSLGSNARLGQGAFIVAEADESDGSFLKLSPTIGVVTNIDAEHLDFYGDLEKIKQVFLDFINKIPFYGMAVLCLDNEGIQDLIPKIEKRFTTYGMTSQADYQAKDVTFEGLTTRYRIAHRGEVLGTVDLNLPGIHNVYNSMASIAIGIELGIPFDTILDALKDLEGVQRRLQVKGTSRGVTVVDDYGHHPTEIRLTLQAVRQCWPDCRIVVVFQPHRYSRTAALFNDFTRAFYQADSLVVLPIYPASEAPIENVDSQSLCEEIRQHGHKDVVFHDGQDAAVSYLKKTLRQGDILLTLGAGNVWQVGEQFLDEWSKLTV